ncbi:MAG: PDZ domain-containing protein [Campylobacterota bacterium]|nr:PDZ domain-containing protein [Campylobacterota bacterium]
MLRLFILISILFLEIFACKGGYDSCKSKLIDSNSFKQNILQIPVTEYKRLVYSKTKPKEKILKQDPFLHLYLVQTDKYFKFPFKINNFLSFGFASVTTKKAIEGKIINHQIGLNHFALFSEKVSHPSLLTNSCCALEGIVTDRGIIEKEYIERFLNTKDTRYSDIGIRLYNNKNQVMIKRINPFIKNNPFKNDDIILSFDGKKVKDSASLMRKILFSKIGSKHTVKLKRGSKILSFKTTSYKRIGGGYKCDTFLESRGLFIDDDLRLLKIEKDFAKYGLKIGDKILKVNGKAISNIDDLGVYLSGFKKNASILFERDGFQFFINMN